MNYGKQEVGRCCLHGVENALITLNCQRLRGVSERFCLCVSFCVCVPLPVYLCLFLFECGKIKRTAEGRKVSSSLPGWELFLLKLMSVQSHVMSVLLQKGGLFLRLKSVYANELQGMRRASLASVYLISVKSIS